MITLLPQLACMFVLTLLVWSYMYSLRLPYLRQNRINPQKLASPEAVNLFPERVNRPSNNLKNLFELPIIFYTLCLALNQQQMVDGLYSALAWLFVVLRVAHSLIHCTINRVIWRFTAYFLSTIVLIAMVTRFTIALFN